MQIIKLDVSKIPREKIFIGAKGKYIDLVLVDHPSEYGDGFVTISQTKEEREAKTKSIIVGSWKHVGQKAAPKEPRKPNPEARKPDDDDSGMPF